MTDCRQVWHVARGEWGGAAAFSTESVVPAMVPRVLWQRAVAGRTELHYSLTYLCVLWMFHRQAAICNRETHSGRVIAGVRHASDTRRPA